MIKSKRKPGVRLKQSAKNDEDKEKGKVSFDSSFSCTITALPISVTLFQSEALYAISRTSL